jgi:hypothetical protein
MREYVSQWAFVRSFVEFLQNHTVQWILSGTFFVHAASWVLLVLYIRPSELPILLRYNVYLGPDLNYVVPWYEAYGIALVAGIFFLINTVLSSFFFRKHDRFACFIFLFGGLSIQAALLVAVCSLIIVNT